MNRRVSIKDSGKKRQFYQILSAFIPGQTYNYSPVLNNRGNPSLTVRTVKIKNGLSAEGKEGDISFWSEPKIRERIGKYSGLPPQEQKLNFIGLDNNPYAEVGIEFDIYPLSFLAQKGSQTFIVWDTAVSEWERIAQAQFVFCDPNSSNEPVIYQFRIKGYENIELARPDEANWANQRIIINGHDDFPLSSKYSYYNDFSRIKTEYENNPSSWEFKPILSNAKVVFSPVHMYDVYYPKIDNPKELVYWLLEQKGIKSDEIRAEKFLYYLLSHPDLGTKQTNKDFPVMISENYKGKQNTVATNTIEALGKLSDPKIKEQYKLHKLEAKSAKKTKIGSEHHALKQYKIASVSYLEPLQCIEMCIGWVTGKLEPGTGDGQAPLHRIKVQTEGKDIVQDQTNRSWNILYDITDSEGLFFRLEGNPGFQATHTFAHLLMKTLPEFCGIDESELYEQIFEVDGAFLIYSREPGEFRTYGLKHVFDNALPEVLEAASDFIECPFEDSHSGCYYCLHKPIGCEWFNLQLNKTLLKSFLD